jgi:ADP-ribose pyrophosphatase YjhB (NUDIX family)
MSQYIVGKRVAKQGQIAVGCSAAILDAKRERILLVPRFQDSRWALPGGYMEAGETLTEACARTVMEETGLFVEARRLVGVYTSPDTLLQYPDGDRLQPVLIHFEAEWVGGEETLGESSAYKFFTHAESKQLKLDAPTRMRVADSFASLNTTIVRESF